MSVEALMICLFIVFMGYFTNPLRLKMFLLAWIGVETGMIVGLLFNTIAEIKSVGIAINGPVWIWILALGIWVVLFAFGRWLAELDN